MNETEVNETTTAANLEKLGFITAARKVQEAQLLKRKLRTAFEHFRVVTPEHIQRFNEKLLEEDGKTMNGLLHNQYVTYRSLVFTAVSQYEGIPPQPVLDALKAAKDLQCFDYFTIATVRSLPDPLLFGVINGSPNKYFIAQWDNDVSITDILTEDEG